jgi:integrase/recombinase XerD
MNPDVQLAGFLESLRVANYSPATLLSRRGSLQCFFKFLRQTGITDLREVTRQTIQDYQAWLLRHQSMGSVLVRLTALRSFFAHLESTDQILLNPCRKMVLPKQPDRLPPSVLTKLQARRLLKSPDLKTSKGLRDRAILEVFYSSGLRLSEMTQLKLDDLDLRNGFIRVNHGKSGKTRIVPMGRTACEAVQAYLTQARLPWSRRRPQERALWLSSQPLHQPLKKPALGSLVQQYGKQAGLRLYPHLWRHTCATHLVNDGANIAYVQKLLGHQRLSTTEIYTRVSIMDVKRTHRRAHPRNRLRV